MKAPHPETKVTRCMRCGGEVRLPKTIRLSAVVCGRRIRGLRGRHRCGGKLVKPETFDRLRGDAIRRAFLDD